MSWIDGVEAGTPIDALLGLRPGLLARYKAFYSALWEDDLLPRRLLELCRLRIAEIHGCAQERTVRDAAVGLSDLEEAALRTGDPAAFAAPEQAALARAEQFPFEHHGISDAAVDWAKTQLGAKAIVALLVALAFFDVSCRWKLAFDLETQPVRTDHPPLNEGALV